MEEPKVVVESKVAVAKDENQNCVPRRSSRLATSSDQPSYCTTRRLSSKVCKGPTSPNLPTKASFNGRKNSVEEKPVLDPPDVAKGFPKKVGRQKGKFRAEQSMTTEKVWDELADATCETGDICEEVRTRTFEVAQNADSDNRRKKKRDPVFRTRPLVKIDYTPRELTRSKSTMDISAVREEVPRATSTLPRKSSLRTREQSVPPRQFFAHRETPPLFSRESTDLSPSTPQLIEVPISPESDVHDLVTEVSRTRLFSGTQVSAPSIQPVTSIPEPAEVPMNHESDVQNLVTEVSRTRLFSGAEDSETPSVSSAETHQRKWTNVQNCCESGSDDEEQIVVDEKPLKRRISPPRDVDPEISPEEAKRKRLEHINQAIKDAVKEADEFLWEERKNDASKKLYRLFLPTAFTECGFDEFIVKQLYARFRPVILKRHYDMNGSGLDSGFMEVFEDKMDDVAKYASNRSWKAQRLFPLTLEKFYKDTDNIKMYIFCVHDKTCVRSFCNDLEKSFGARQIQRLYDEKRRFLGCIAYMSYEKARKLTIDPCYAADGKPRRFNIFQVADD